ncbi:PREDICTED: caspase-10-like, partial [Galeopterus variegatus]|uniref:Caspase-10-like n=1 Tax=Galeopterus variegatus TaxID=482537 RepID=A0ABM0SFB1_GALVR
MTFRHQCLASSSDKNGEMSFREKLLIIDSDLGDYDVKRLKFLCQGLVSHKKLERSSSALDIFNHLLAEEQLSKEEPFLLAELLYLIKQNSLLRHLHCTKEQVESFLPTRRRVSLFIKLLYEVSEGIDSESLKAMTFLLRDQIPNTSM